MNKALITRKSGEVGFTLIELLVVISIISLLASVSLASLNQARAKARDTALIANIRTLITALEFYYDANNNKYPLTNSDGYYAGGFVWAGKPIPWVTSIKGDATDVVFKNALRPYLTQLPNPGTVGWVYPTSRIRYMLVPPSDNSTITSMSGIDCGPDYIVTRKCYKISFVTEGDTRMGPGGVLITLINGVVKYTVPLNNFSVWGFQ